MKRSRLEILLIVVAVLALSAGVVAGLLAARIPAANGSPPALAIPGPGAMERSLGEELGLSPDQREKMREIWEGVHGQVQQTFEHAQALEKQRDEALVAMLNDEQKAKFQSISKSFADRYDELSRQRNEIFEKAVAQTDKLLDEKQKQKYHDILKTHVRPEPPGPRTFTAPASREPATRPAT